MLGGNGRNSPTKTSCGLGVVVGPILASVASTRGGGGGDVVESLRGYRVRGFLHLQGRYGYWVSQMRSSTLSLLLVSNCTMH